MFVIWSVWYCWNEECVIQTKDLNGLTNFNVHLYWGICTTVLGDIMQMALEQVYWKGWIRQRKPIHFEYPKTECFSYIYVIFAAVYVYRACAPQNFQEQNGDVVTHHHSLTVQTDVDNVNVSIPNNSHNSAAAPAVSTTVAKDGTGANNQVVANSTGEAPEEKEKKGGFGRKEKSVLQTKLTRLAIQIGYAGEFGRGWWIGYAGEFGRGWWGRRGEGRGVRGRGVEAVWVKERVYLSFLCFR